MRSQALPAPPPGTPMCAYLVVHDATLGQLIKPRPCKRPAGHDSPYCGVHQMVALRVPQIEVRDGGFCVWCGQPAKSYVCDRVTIALCVRHGKALSRALREGR